MKNMRKLVPAFAMLMVAAIMMSTASFAWFSMNTTATASGMQIKAKSTGGLAIASYTTGSDNAAVAPSTTAYLSSAEAKWFNSDADVEPTSHDGTNWYYAEAKEVDKSTVKGEYSVASVSGNTGGAGYFIKTKWSIKSLKEEGNTVVKVSGITVTGMQKPNATDPDKMDDIAGLAELAKSIRVAIYANSTWTYFAPLYSAAPSDKLQCVATTTTTKDANLQYGSAPSTTILTLVNNVAQDVEVYIYFEGEDPNCKSSNAINLDDLNVVLTFTAG